MPHSKIEKRNAAKKIAEAKTQAKKSVRSTKPEASAGGKVVKGKKPLSTGKKK